MGVGVEAPRRRQNVARTRSWNNKDSGVHDVIVSAPLVGRPPARPPALPPCRPAALPPARPATHQQGDVVVGLGGDCLVRTQQRHLSRNHLQDREGGGGQEGGQRGRLSRRQQGSLGPWVNWVLRRRRLRAHKPQPHPSRSHRRSRTSAPQASTAPPLPNTAATPHTAPRHPAHEPRPL